jgi:tRNA threonylcarbamoyl adenosine modification protein (Sua5/YciO/YrdC/YwlC family)
VKKIFIDPADIDSSRIKEVVSTISDGGIVALPTETVYGLAAYPNKKEAVVRLYEIKKRPQDKPFTFVIDEIDKVITRYFTTLSPFGYRLIEKFWPGPLTIVYYSQNDEKIGIRVPSHIVIREVLKELDSAVYLPSANISGEKEAISASEVEAVFDDEIDLIVDSGRCLYARASTVIDLTYHPFQILREGVVSEKEIIDVFVKKRILFVCTGNTCRSPMAQFLFKKYLEEAKPYLKDRYEIISRGTGAFNNAPISSHVASILKEKENLDTRGFVARRLDKNIILSSDLIFTMEDVQSSHVLNIEPTAEGRIFALKKFLPHALEKDIPDPIGRSYDVYEEVYSLIKRVVLELKDWL